MRWIIHGIILTAAVALASTLYAEDGLVKTGVSIGLTGKYAKMGDMQKKAYLLWEESINNKGGLLGKKIEMVIEDDKSDKKTAMKIYERFIVEEKIDMVIGPYSSGITGAIMPICEKYGYPVLAAGAASDRLWKGEFRHLFGLFIPASRYAVGFLEMVAMKGVGDIAIVSADDTFSLTIGKGANEWGRKFGLNIVLYEQFKKGTRDLSALARRIADVGAGTVMMCGHFNESVDMIESFKKIGWRPDNYFATVGPAMAAFHQKLGEDAERVFSSSQWEPDVLYQAGDHALFLKPFKEKYGVEPSYHAAIAFAACQILEKAIRKTRSFDREKIRDVLATMDAMSIIGRYGVDKNGMQIKHFPINIQWQNGRKTIVWPEDIAAATPLLK